MWKALFMLVILASGFGFGYSMRQYHAAPAPCNSNASIASEFVDNEPKPPGYDPSLVLPPIGNQPGEILGPQILGMTARHYKDQADLTKEPTNQEPPLFAESPPFLEPIPMPNTPGTLASSAKAVPSSNPNMPPVIIPVEGTVIPPTVRLPAPLEEPAPPAFAENVVPPRLIRNIADCVFVNHRDIKLSFEVAKSGSSGVKAVELWCRRPEQKNYHRVDRMEGDKAPFPTHLWSEGEYEFRLVFVSGTGVKSVVPDQKEPPDLCVCLDTTAPIVQMLPPQADPDVHGAIKLRWHAEDPHLEENPIRLEFSADGQKWVAITNEWLPNSGTLSWVVPEGLPSELYVRVQARDKAGNIGESLSPSKVPVDLTVPEGKINGLLEVLPQPRIQADYP